MTAERGEKARVTMISVGAAVVLTTVKLLVGVLTGSLGMLSEAAHSGFDLVASVVTFFSVRIAERPADADHPYGHGRVENLSAMAQGLLLLATAGWIVYESALRLFVVRVPVETSVWSFVVMGGSIGIDFWRSRMLLAAARKFHSAALEADALNFRADMYSSAVVILGLALTAFGERAGGVSWLAKGDAAAALVVALMIMRLSGGLAFRAASVLLDRAPEDLAARMTHAVAAVPGVVHADAVRLRESGHRLFADVVVTAARTASLAEAHDLTERIETAVRGLEPRTETLVHVEPIPSRTETPVDRIRAVALSLGLNTHHEHVYRVEHDAEASLHLEVPPTLTLREAHALAERLRAALRRDNPDLAVVDTHLEVAVPAPEPRQRLGADATPTAAQVIGIVQGLDEGARCREVRRYALPGGGWSAVLHCEFAPDVPMAEVHRRTERIEFVLREWYPELEEALIEARPAPPISASLDGRVR